MFANVLAGDRATPDELVEQCGEFSGQQVFTAFANSVPALFMVLNETRQIVYANHRLTDKLGLDSPDQVVGKRPGEAFGCKFANEVPSGCGHSSHCDVCGALRAILDAQAGQQSIQECRLSTARGDSMDYRVWATPYEFKGHRYVIFSLLDIASEKRREALERTFFHDLMNTAGGISGLVSVLPIIRDDPQEAEQIIDMIQRASGRLLDEIRSARAMTEAENDTLVLTPQPVSLKQVMQEVRDLYARYPGAEEICIELDLPEPDSEVHTDAALLGRALGNLTKNALEASQAGECIRLSARQEGEQFYFTVQNPAVMPEEVFKQVFQRSFSTKGRGRGIGTYSVRLFVENYLGGKVSCQSYEGQGTVFQITLPASLPA